LDDEGTKIIRSTGKNWKNADQGAATALVAALDPALNSRSLCPFLNQADTPKEKSGIYLADCQFAEAASHATDKEIAERLWELSEKLVSQKFQI
jgi:hypothetical protein